MNRLLPLATQLPLSATAWPAGGAGSRVQFPICKDPIDDVACDQSVRAEAFARLLAIPGVTAVGLGWKERAGIILSRLAYRVYVRAKRPLSDLAPEELVPPSAGGIETDVHVADDWMDAGRQNAFLTPGCKVTRYIPGTETSAGTLTVLVEKAGKHYVLSCDHVLLGGQQLQSDAISVYSPFHTSCDCRSPIGAIPRTPVQGTDDGDPVVGARLDDLIEIGGKKFLIDAALAMITATPAAGTNLITLPGGTTVKLDQGLGDLSTLASTSEPDPDTPAHGDMRVVTTPPTVHKLGATTSYTTGKVVQLSSVRTFATPGHLSEVVDVWELTVAPSPGTSWTQDYQLADPNIIDTLTPKWTGKPVTPTKLPNGWLRLTGPVFALPGDSGSPVWDENRKLVGIVTKVAGVDAIVMIEGKPVPMKLPNGLAKVQYAPAAFQALGLTSASILAPGVPLRGTTVEVQAPTALLDMREVAVVRRAVQETESGQRLLEIVTRNLESVTELVHHRRRVKLVWHRNHGPAFAKMFIEAFREPTRPLPEKVAGVTFRKAFERFIDVLKLEGDARLKRDLERDGNWLVELAGSERTVGELIASLSAVKHDEGCHPAEAAALRIANAAGVPGTVGAVVRGEDGAALLLANHHVVFGDGAAVGDRVCALDDDGRPVHIGYGLRGRLGRVTYAGQTHFVDCALVDLRPRQDLPDWVIAGLDALPRTGASARPGLAVQKVGPSTGHTHGVISAVEHFDAPFISGQAFQAPKQLLIESAETELRFCSQGDSGAAVADSSGRMVGLLWGTNGTSNGIASPIGPILHSLGVTLDEVSDG